MIQINGTTPCFGSINSAATPLSFSQLFDLKVKKLEAEYLKNRGNSTHYRNWVSFLADAHRFDDLEAVILAYRHDSPEFDAINALYIAKMDYEIRDNWKSAFDISTYYTATFPDDMEGIYYSVKFAHALEGTLIEQHPMAKPLKCLFSQNYKKYLAEYKDQTGHFKWMREFASFFNPNYIPSTMEPMPVYAFADILAVVCSRSKFSAIPVLEEQMQIYLKANPFNVRLLSCVVDYYVHAQDFTNAERYCNLLTTLVQNPTWVVILAYIQYEYSKQNKAKALEWTSHKNAVSYSCFYFKLLLLDQLNKSEELFAACEKDLSKFSHSKGQTIDRYRVWYHNFKMERNYKAKEYDKTLESANQILKIEPKHGAALQYSAYVTVLKGDAKEAWKFVASKSKHAPDDNDPVIHAYVTRVSCQRFLESETQLRNALFIDPKNYRYLTFLIDILMIQRKYEEALEVLEKYPPTTDELLVKREVILRRLNRASIIPIGQLKRCRLLELFYGEGLVKAGKFEEAAPYFKSTTIYDDPDTLIASLECLMAVGDVEGAKDFLAKIGDDRKIRLGMIRIKVEEAKIEKVKQIKVPALAPAPAVQVVGKPPEKVLFGMTENAISLMKDGFSRKPCCGSEGIDPLTYRRTLIESQTPPFIYYPNSYTLRIRKALDLLEQFNNLSDPYLLQYNLYSFLECLSPVNPSREQKEGMQLFSSRVVSTEVLASLRSNLLNLPALTVEFNSFIREFVKTGIGHSIKMSFSDPEPLSASLPALEWVSPMDHIKVVLHFDVIRNELEFIRRNSHTWVDESNKTPFMVAAQRILSSIDFIAAFDDNRGKKLRRIFIELVEGYNKPYDFSLVKLNRFIPLVKLKLNWLEQV